MYQARRVSGRVFVCSISYFYIENRSTADLNNRENKKKKQNNTEQQKLILNTTDL